MLAKELTSPRLRQRIAVPTHVREPEVRGKQAGIELLLAQRPQHRAVKTKVEIKRELLADFGRIAVHVDSI